MKQTELYSAQLPAGLQNNLEQARTLSYAKFGRQIAWFVPGMFNWNGHRGKYPALSITGADCALKCPHCQGKLLKTMLPAQDPASLLQKAKELEAAGAVGILLSGGCTPEGSLPWDDFIPAIEAVIRFTKLRVSVHTGFLSKQTAKGLAQAGVHQALVDVIGSAMTAHCIYRLPGLEPAVETLEALYEAGLDVAPHIVAGLDYGRIRGEYNALKMLQPYNPRVIVMVVLQPQRGTVMEDISPPLPEHVAQLLVEARFMFPESRLHLGCAKPRGPYARRLEALALQAGVNAMAVPGDTTLRLADEMGLKQTFYPVCCSVAAHEWPVPAMEYERDAGTLFV